MKLIMSTVLVVWGWSLAAGCDNPSSDFDYVYCATQLFVQADKDLNTAYQELRGKLNPAGVALLRTGQLAWIRERNASCTRRDDSGRTTNLDCAVAMTQARTAFLKARIRECNSTGCVNSRLREP